MNFIAIASSAIALLLAVAGGVNATFECEKLWNGPSKDNSPATCFTDAKHLQNLFTDPTRMTYLSAVVIALIVIVFVIIFCPLVTICRYVCGGFGSNHRRPGYFCGGSAWDEVDEKIKQQHYDPRCVKFTVWAPWIILVLCIAPMAILLRGADTIKSAYEGIFDDVASLTTYVDNKIEAIRGNVTLGNGSYIPPLTGSYFTDATNQTANFRTSLYKREEDFSSYVEMAKTVAIVVGVVPIVFFAFNAVFSWCKIRRLFPLLNSGGMVLITIIYGLVAFTLLIVALLLRDTCDEVSVYTNGRKPGMFSWYVVPLCDSVAPFDSLKNQIDVAEGQNSKSACEQLLKICDQNETYDPSSTTTASHVFYCPTISAASECTSFKNVTFHLNNSIIKNSTPPLCNSTGACTVKICSTNCTQSDVRDVAGTTLTYLDYANRALDAFNIHVRPVLSCRNTVDVALRALASCGKIQDSAWLIGVGALLFECFACASMIIIWVGQKRWFDPNDDGTGKKIEESNEPVDNRPRARHFVKK